MGDALASRIAKCDDSFMKLPGVDNAVVADAKIRDYLLAPNHPIGQFKARFFSALGYDNANWHELADGLIRHAEEHEVASAQSTEYGTTYLIKGALMGPNGKSARICVAWIVLRGENVPRLVTAYPD
ncbi:MAG: hypothetical protein U0625_00170 [Phycisphaerales bacterium]